MPLLKTDIGRAALLDRARCRGVLERRVLILSDGQRRREQLLELLDAAAAAAIDRLLRDGYLVDDAAARRAALSIVPSRPGPALVRSPATTAAKAGPGMGPPAPSPRRSLAASKMYMVDMLQLQRDDRSAVLKLHIHASPDEDELVRRLAWALRHIGTLVTPSYAQRIGERLAETLPEAHLPALEAGADYPLDAVA